MITMYPFQIPFLMLKPNLDWGGVKKLILKGSVLVNGLVALPRTGWN